MNRRDFLTTSSKVACACALGVGSLLTKSCSNPNEPSTPIDSTGVELDFDLTTDEFIHCRSMEDLLPQEVMRLIQQVCYCFALEIILRHLQGDVLIKVFN